MTYNLLHIKRIPFILQGYTLKSINIVFRKFLSTIIFGPSLTLYKVKNNSTNLCGSRSCHLVMLSLSFSESFLISLR